MKINLSPFPSEESIQSIWSSPMQTAGQVECKWVVICNAKGWSGRVQFSTKASVAGLTHNCGPFSAHRPWGRAHPNRH